MSSTAIHVVETYGSNVGNNTTLRDDDISKQLVQPGQQLGRNPAA